MVQFRGLAAGRGDGLHRPVPALGADRARPRAAALGLGPALLRAAARHLHPRPLDSFHHARDAWAIMPAAPILSGITALVAALACAVGYSTLRARDMR